MQTVFAEPSFNRELIASGVYPAVYQRVEDELTGDPRRAMIFPDLYPGKQKVESPQLEDFY